MSGDEMVVLIAQAMYESDREAFGEEWPDWEHRNGLTGADYMNRAQAAVKVLWGTVPPWMEGVAYATDGGEAFTFGHDEWWPRDRYENMLLYRLTEGAEQRD